jgi:hypothetical protein
LSELVLRDRLGESGTRELAEFVERRSDEVRSDVMDMCNVRVNDVSTQIADRFAEVKMELSEKIGGLKVELSDRLAEMRFELLRWTFVFWVGQFTAVIMAVFAALALFAD